MIMNSATKTKNSPITNFTMDDLDMMSTSTALPFLVFF